MKCYGMQHLMRNDSVETLRGSVVCSGGQHVYNIIILLFFFFF